MSNIFTRIRLIWWAILGRPIIYGCKFKDGLVLTEDNHNVYVAKNSFGTVLISALKEAK